MMSLSGITPACAGKTNPKNTVWFLYQDHPRVCGKNSRFPGLYPPDPGSPPRVREKHSQLLLLLPVYGITPACAGKTTAITQTDSKIRDHPRVCGKNSALYKRNSSLVGSPPRVREKPDNFCTASSFVRITPACAGKTLARALSLESGQDHPRVCGKNSCCL